MTNLIDHLLESTLFAAAAWGLTLALRNNRAALRYGIWFAASCKFLIPFSMLVALGSQFQWRTAPASTPSHLNQVVEPAARTSPESAVRDRNTDREESPSGDAEILFGIWLCGCTAGLFSWLRQWRRARAAVRAATPRGRLKAVRVMSSYSRIEPGVFGILRPVLLLPQGVEHRLKPEQIDAILAHELCHVRRRDNLMAAIHMLVETIFWFHPAVWLIRARLAEEREFACDEAVLRESVDPEVYAEGILNVCRFYLEPRLACVSGVSGSNLKKRIETIMTNSLMSDLNFAKRLLLAGAAAAAVAGPVFIGFLNAPAIRAQSPALAFEVASVKPSGSGDRRLVGFDFQPGRFTAKNVTLKALIAIAYDLPFTTDRVSGGPVWVRTEGFDIEANAAIPAATSVKAREAMMKLMLQGLLAERFKLTLHQEKKEMPVYSLSVGKNGPKLKQAAINEKDCTGGQDRCHVINGGIGRGLHAKAADMSDVVVFVANWTDRPLIDKTGLQGLYELDTEGWAPMRPRPPRPDGQPTAEDTALSDPAQPTLFMIFDRLGLKLEAKKGPVETFTIDQADRPTAN
jgi:bla regulator protein BlaR1